MTQWGLDTLFNPAKRHMDEEKRRLLSTREELGDSSGGKRIDLESGKVTIRKGDSDDTAEQEPESPTAPSAASDAAARPAEPTRADPGHDRGPGGRGFHQGLGDIGLLAGERGFTGDNCAACGGRGVRGAPDLPQPAGVGINNDKVNCDAP